MDTKMWLFQRVNLQNRGNKKLLKVLCGTHEVGWHFGEDNEFGICIFPLDHDLKNRYRS